MVGRLVDNRVHGRLAIGCCLDHLEFRQLPNKGPYAVGAVLIAVIVAEQLERRVDDALELQVDVMAYHLSILKDHIARLAALIIGILNLFSAKSTEKSSKSLKIILCRGVYSHNPLWYKGLYG